MNLKILIATAAAGALVATTALAQSSMAPVANPGDSKMDKPMAHHGHHRHHRHHRHHHHHRGHHHKMMKSDAAPMAPAAPK